MTYLYRPKNRWDLVNALLFTYLGLCLLIGYLLGARHDYLAYQWQWRDILNGLDPWILNGAPTTNAYGPLHNAFALFYSWNPLLPKLSFISAWFVVTFYSIRHLNWKLEERKWVFLFFCFNPFFWIEFISWGHHEAILAALVFFATILHERKKEVLSGICIGLGILFKFLPIFLVPFFSFGNKKYSPRLNPRFLVACLATVLAGYGIAYHLWGVSVFYPLVFASQRPPTQLSIFHWIQVTFLPLFGLPLFEIPNSTLVQLVIAATSKFLMIAGTVWIFLSYLRGFLSRSRAVTAEILTLLLFFQVGHPQFHSTTLFLLPLILSEEPFPEKKATLQKAFLLYGSLLTAFQVLVVSFGQYSPWSARLALWLAFPFFVINLFTIGSLLATEGKPRPSVRRGLSPP